MLNRIISLFLLIFACSYAHAVQKIDVNIAFDWLQPSEIFKEKIHIDKKIILDADMPKYELVMSQTNMGKKFPVTLALLVKQQKVNSNELTLQFLLVEYGFDGKNTLISEPKIIIANGQTAEMKISNLLNLKLVGKWS